MSNQCISLLNDALDAHGGADRWRQFQGVASTIVSGGRLWEIKGAKIVRTPRRAQLAAFLRARGIQTGIHYPVATHRQPAVERFTASPLPVTERLVDEILTLPISAGHTEAEIDAVAAAVREFFGA